MEETDKGQINILVENIASVRDLWHREHKARREDLSGNGWGGLRAGSPEWRACQREQQVLGRRQNLAKGAVGTECSCCYEVLTTHVIRHFYTSCTSYMHHLN